MRARSNLEVVVSVLVAAVDHLAVNADDGAPSGGLGALIGITTEVKLAGLAEVLKPLAGGTAILTNGDQLVRLNVLEGNIGAVVEVLQVGAELLGNHGDLALNS